jgi:serine/threonine-protein kinase
VPADSRKFTPVPRQLLGNKYEVLEPIGRGGMASVWMGLTHGEAGFTRKVAIKRVLRHLKKDEKFEGMFVEEAQLITELNHPNITQVHDFGRDHEGGYFIVMEWVEGLNLTGFVRAYARVDERPPWHIACAIGIEVLRALAAAHARTDAAGNPAPIIHRDVAPSNILVGVNGNVKLTDFGLARAIDRPGTTDPGTVKGKVAYMDPEVLEGAAPDPRADLFAVAVVLWETLASRRLFGGDGLTDVEVAMRVMRREIPPLQELHPGLPKGLQAFLDRALRGGRDERYGSAHEMIEALKDLLRHHPESSDGAALAAAARRALDALPVEARNPG